MHSSRFDAVTRVLAADSSRRAFGRLVAGLGLLSTQRLPTSAKNKKPKPNDFGCLDVGQKCQGKDSKCCSGICDGKKPKHGKKDKSRCVGHDESTCSSGQRSVSCGGSQSTPCTTSAGTTGRCETTTGNAAYCADIGARECVACAKDVDCQTLCGPQAACIPCTNCPNGTACVGAQNIPTCRIAV
jgi:hypothetical protein